MKAITGSLFVAMVLTMVSSVATADPCSVRVNFTGNCQLYKGYGSGMKTQSVTPGEVITLDGTPQNPSGPTHFNCVVGNGAKVPHLPNGWMLAVDGPISMPSSQFGEGVVTMPTQPAGLALNGGALTCAGQAASARGYYQ